MTTQQWTAPASIASALTTELNSLANGSLSALSSAIDNTSNRYQYLALELNLASLNPTGTPFVEVYLFPSIDGTNYADGSASLSQCLVASIPVTTGSGAKLSTATGILIPPFLFKLAVRNQTNVSLASSGSTLEYRLYGEEAV